ncbi:MAG: hypothetical protein DMG75_00070 [Acidobacteria bacterium]|nr:MAG: hypothetical protein DMG75_00070 [Acidobacteriota bacterium]
MSPRTQLAYYVLWLAHPTLQVAVAGVMLWRKLHRKFPVFFSYIISQIVIFCVVFPVYRLGNYTWFFYVYWIGTAIGVVLGFKVIHEIFLDVFRPYHTLKDLCWWRLWWRRRVRRPNNGRSFKPPSPLRDVCA